MLDRSKLAQEVERVSGQLFKEHHTLAWLTKQSWQSIAADDLFLQKIDASRIACNLVTWQAQLADIFDIKNTYQHYAVLAVDGSQIYPDHHVAGVDCFLINTGGCFLSYSDASSVKFFSQPTLYVPDQLPDELASVGFSTDLVDLLREEHEFIVMVGKTQEFIGDSQVPFMVLCDGNLLFWHLESKPAAIKELFMQRYLAPLHSLYTQKVLYAGYLSSTKSRDICQLLEIGLEGNHEYAPLRATLAHMTDADIMADILKPTQRTTIFYSNAAIVEMYPTHLKPCFFYLHVGSEIVRIEIPFWIARHEELVDRIAALCLDQCSKGRGYPVALAEAHAQAVVKSPDRDFFYHLIGKLAIEQNQRVGLSPKSLKKRSMNI